MTMETQQKQVITVSTKVNAPIEKVWEYFSKPEHIVKWNNASEDWHTPKAENDFRVGGGFVYRMEAKDGSFGFDFGGKYDEVHQHQRIAYTLGDNRKVELDFSSEGEATTVTEKFEAESTHDIEMQRNGWQAILDNFRKYTEGN